VVAEKGYGTATVADVVERARVSRRTFYEHFEDKEACFLAAYGMGVEVVLGRLSEAAQAEEAEGWRARLRSDLSTYLAVLAEEPAFAKALHVEILSAGPAALARRAEVFTLFSARTKQAYELARAEDPGRPQLAPESFLLHSGGIDELVRECLRTRGASALPELTDIAIASTLALFRALD